MPTFKAGDRVVSSVNAQGLRLGALYEVVDVLRNVYALGSYETTIVVELPPSQSERRFTISNAHLVLRAAPGPCATPDDEQHEDVCTVCGDVVASSDPKSTEFVCDLCLGKES